MEDGKKITRRGFIAGAAVAGMGLAGAGLAGCSPKVTATAAADSGTSVSDDGTIATLKADEGNSAVDPTIDWLGEEPQIDDSDVESEESCDVVVVGLGNSGVVAYRSAAEAGAKVIGVERCASFNATGGQFALIGGNVSARWNRPEMSKEEIINTHMDECGYYCKRSIMSRYAYEVGDMFDWLIAPLTDLYIGTSQMEQLSSDVTNYILPDSYPLADWYDFRAEACPTFPTSIDYGSLASIYKEEMATAEATGNASAYYGHIATKLIMEKGSCTGLYVRNAETNKYKKISTTGGVILATGDYSTNEKMCAAFVPDTLRNGVATMSTLKDVEGNGTNAGDGHKMGAWAGARIQAHHAPMIHHMGGGADISGSGVMGTNGFLNLNLDGERFMNEQIAGQQLENQVELQPQRTTYQIFDSAWPDQVQWFPPAHGCVTYCMDDDKLPNTGASFNCRSLASIEKAVSDGRCLKSDTIDGLLDQMEGMDKETALASIQHYNDICAAGQDTDFGKEARLLFPLQTPPYYACAFKPAIMLAVEGGLSSDENCHTFDQDDNVIKGLYVVGNIQGDRFAVHYPISLKGLGVGMGEFYGYIAGKNAAAGV